MATKINFISTDEAAERLKVSARHVRKLVNEKKLPAQQIANRLFIDPADVDRMIKDQEAIGNLLTVAEAAERLGVSARRVGHLIEQGRITIKRTVGRQFYLDPEDIEAFAEERSSSAHATGMLTPAQAARRRHVSRQYIWELITKGKLPAEKQERSYLIKVEDVDAIDIGWRKKEPEAVA
jgi:excisionase family DNA binding protein